MAAGRERQIHFSAVGVGWREEGEGRLCLWTGGLLGGLLESGGELLGGMGRLVAVCPPFGAFKGSPRGGPPNGRRSLAQGEPKHWVVNRKMGDARGWTRIFGEQRENRARLERLKAIDSLENVLCCFLPTAICHST